MNIKKITDFIVNKSGYRVPLKFKLLYAPKTITKEDLHVKEDLNLSFTNITSLPKGLKVGGFLGLSSTKITSLPKGLEVRGYITVSIGKEEYFKENFPKFAHQIR